MIGIIRYIYSLLLYFPHFAILYLLNKDMLYSDIDMWKKAFKGNNDFFHLFLRFPEFRSLCYFRIKEHKIVVFLLSILAKPQFHLEIHGNKIDSIIFYHPFSTYINCKSIGKGTIIRNNTTIGNKFNNQDYRPIIGSNVDIGVNSVIIGNVHIGDNSIIGAGSVVVKDVDPNTVVAGNPAKFIKNI